MFQCSNIFIAERHTGLITQAGRSQCRRVFLPIKYSVFRKSCPGGIAEAVRVR